MDGRGVRDATDLRHAFAVLGLSPPVTESRLRRRYKTLVKRWHPDRFQSDPAGQAEANQKLRDINIAYDVVAAALASPGGASEPPPPASPSQPSHATVTPPSARVQDQRTSPASWSPHESDALVDAINRMSSWTPAGEPDWIRVISGLITVFWFLFVATRKGVAVLLPLAVLLSLVLVWFPENVEAATTKLRGVSRPVLPDWLIRLIGWVALLALTGISGMLIGKPHS